MEPRKDGKHLSQSGAGSKRHQATLAYPNAPLVVKDSSLLTTAGASCECAPRS